MTSKEKSAELVNKFNHVFSCPICHSPMNVVDLSSLKCINNHTFDFAKQGYVNMLTRPSNSHYDKELFSARQKMILDSDLFTLLHKEIAKVIDQYSDVSKLELILLDAGSGEGSHLHRILDECNNRKITGIGIDISKEGIKMAASHYKQSIWLVADLANSPLANESCHVILNILSPANYEEFKRTLAPDGLLVKVVPRSNYLTEIREALFEDTAKKTYKNDKTTSLFEQHFQLLDERKISYTKELKSSQLLNLARMSPLGWNLDEEELEQRLLHRGISEITIDLDILVGTKG